MSNAQEIKRYYFVLALQPETCRLVNGLIDIHPLAWQKETMQGGCHYVLCNWQEVTEQEYQTYRDQQYAAPLGVRTFTTEFCGIPHTDKNCT